MTTANDVINGAAEELGVKTAEIALEAEDHQMFFTRLNDMLLEWADTGLTPAFVEVVNGSDTINIDGNARGAVKYNLALMCASAFQKQVSLSLSDNADKTLTKLQASTSFIGEVAFPDTLPMGSGNYCAGDDTDHRFFPNNVNENF